MMHIFKHYAILVANPVVWIGRYPVCTIGVLYFSIRPHKSTFVFNVIHPNPNNSLTRDRSKNLTETKRVFLEIDLVHKSSTSVYYHYLGNFGILIDMLSHTVNTERLNRTKVGTCHKLKYTSSWLHPLIRR